MLSGGNRPPIFPAANIPETPMMIHTMATATQGVRSCTVLLSVDRHSSHSLSLWLRNSSWWCCFRAEYRLKFYRLVRVKSLPVLVLGTSERASISRRCFSHFHLHHARSPVRTPVPRVVIVGRSLAEQQQHKSCCTRYIVCSRSSVATCSQ